jgi:hypothetical protein
LRLRCANNMRGCAMPVSCAAGHEVFRDQDRENGIKPGADWQQTLLRQLHICDAVVFLNSMASQESMWCHSELVLATAWGKRVYPIDLGPGLAPHPLLHAVQGIAFDEDIDARVGPLTEALVQDGLADVMPEWQHGRPPYPGLAAMDLCPTPASSSAGPPRSRS